MGLSVLVLRWGRFTRPGTFPFRRGHSARAGTGILSPTASNAPAWGDTHPAVQDVPDGAERPCGAGLPKSWTYFSVEDCVLLQKVTAGAQSFGGEVRPGRRTQSSMFQDGCTAPSSVTGQSRTRACRSTLADMGVRRLTGRGCREAPPSRPIRAGRHNLVVVFTARKGARRPRWTRLPVPGCSGIGFAPWLQDDASPPTPALRPCASGPRSRARPTTNRPELGSVPTPPVPPTGPPDVG